jgi:plasmid maintenance system antidote protein VapI
LNIKKVLEKYGLHQKDVANILGLTEGAVSRIVSGEVDLRIKHAMKLGSTLGFDWKELYQEEKGA